MVAEALSALSQQHRQVLLECFFRRQNLDQVAVRMGLSSASVKERLSYAVRSLRLALQERGVIV